MGQPTIKDIAREAGVSTATVSRVINGQVQVRPEFQAKVQRAVELLSYRPNAIARSLKGERTYTIGVVVSDIDNPFFMTLAKNVERAVRDHGYQIVVCSTEEDPKRELSYLQMLHERRVDGIVLSTTGRNNTYVQDLGRLMPIVLTSRKYDELALDRVSIDGYHGAFLLTNHLIQMGHRRIAFIREHSMSTAGDERFRGFSRAIEEAGLPLFNELVFDAGRSGHLAAAVTRSIFALAEPPTAIFAASILIAKGAMMATNMENKTIPDDISLVCFGLDEFKMLFRPSLACVVLHPEMLGAKAGELILHRIAEPSAKQMEVVFAPDLFIGRSVRAIDYY